MQCNENSRAPSEVSVDGALPLLICLRHFSHNAAQRRLCVCTTLFRSRHANGEPIVPLKCPCRQDLSVSESANATTWWSSAHKNSTPLCRLAPACFNKSSASANPANLARINVTKSKSHHNYFRSSASAKPSCLPMISIVNSTLPDASAT